ncbi:glycoside hydrolase family 19 protein [Paenibacillus apiarius]|uniref:Fibronectin type III domain-containing protein n=1 Tax=Paenibacillus apiarius TaxID=46240 RepID=A0ABT4DQL9_9BACL|nr:glycoside hydrolase family 19 protein [Paenibacillus apiarius]MCY9513366.1 fibronectin type III domain-containing protein [Paenibacillus apiarius]MCY9519662.1 fibronectin type III domain-containing protein [Paenibacillus apiarius]MCY9553282.1 fibronectin type III domain-containing protein [Paenibacillus apiarius]MCY9557132.1 fibronectin type III domain-containing protein [Paenibacillus apiarius]MCY9682127.1 fibronectin type III domain-containing protein [Paenibacillus apiarius]
MMLSRSYPYSGKFLRRMSALMLGTSLLIAPLGAAVGAEEAATVQGSEPIAEQLGAAAAAAEAWSAEKSYATGSIVTYNGKQYRAKWWTQNDVPDKPAANPWETPWELIGDDPGNPGGGESDTEAPTAPSGLHASAKSSNAITLSWEAATDNIGIAKYDVYRNGTFLASVTALSYADSGLQADTSYTYTVKAYDAAGNGTASAELSVRTDAAGTDLGVGQSRILTDEQIASLWQGIDPQYAPDKAAQAVQAALSKAQFEELFPLRIGSPEWHQVANGKPYYRADQTDYYSYDNLIAAVRDVANIKYKIEMREGSAWLQRISRLDKAQKKETLLLETAGFNDDWAAAKPILTRIVDFGSFLKEGADKDKKRELAAFLANIAHETGGGWATAPGGELRWALYWNEEVSYIGGNGGIGYVDGTNKDFPPVSGKSYHGRGPIQLSWNYNYGLFSSIIYGDKQVLLNEPERITADGKLGFMTAILFWMTPQSPKPSCHDVMVGNWVPSAEEIAKGLNPPGFGVTIMVINGGQEGNLGESDVRIARRAGHYRDITAKEGVDITGEKLDTLGMRPF